MKYYSQYLSHDLFELQDSLSGLSKSNRWVKLADNLPWDKIEKEYNKRLRNRHNGAGNKPARMIVGAFIVKHVEKSKRREDHSGNSGKPIHTVFVGTSEVHGKTGVRAGVVRAGPQAAWP